MIYLNLFLAKGWKACELAKVLKVSDAIISKWRSGKRNMPETTSMLLEIWWRFPEIARKYM